MFRIGDFARLAQVSTRALRLYDRLGLLKPASVADFTDYRYYTIDQLPRLNRILALKDLGFSLDQIARLLDEELSAEALKGMLRLKQAEAQQQLRDVQARLTRVAARLKQIELEDIMPDYEIVLKKIQPVVEDPQCAACNGLKWQRGEGHPTEDVFIKRVAAPADLPLDTAPDARPIFFLRSRPTSQGFPIEDAYVQPGSDFDLVTLPFVEAHTLPGVETAATTLHVGGHDTITLACRALIDWIKANQCEVAGHYQEVTLRENELYELILPILPA